MKADNPSQPDMNSSSSAATHLAIGVFDGVHLGHQAVIQSAVDGARESGGQAILVTFDPHPISVLRPNERPRLLTHTAHKLRIAKRYGVDETLIIPFDAAFAKQSGQAFIEALAERYSDLRQICVGSGWKFGSGRSGDFELLLTLGKELGFVASGAEAVKVDGITVSSTAIRKAVQSGDLAQAVTWLGRNYSVQGEVVKGKQLGRTIGFPTANLEVKNEQLPPNGVYAVSVRFPSVVRHGVANLGNRPTVEEEGAQRKLEVYLLDYDGPEFYGEELEVEFVEHLREEQKFDGLDALTAQIRKDAAAAEQVFRD